MVREDLKAVTGDGIPYPSTLVKRTSALIANIIHPQFKLSWRLRVLTLQ
jgi:hypothetical protein